MEGRKEGQTRGRGKRREEEGRRKKRKDNR